MMSECCKCKGEILTEADPYVYQSTPSGVKLTCYSCYKITPEQKIIQLEQQLAQQKALLDEAVKVIEFYGDTWNWTLPEDDKGVRYASYSRPCIIEDDRENLQSKDVWKEWYGGKRARAFLAKKEINQILGKEEGGK